MLELREAEDFQFPARVDHCFVVSFPEGEVCRKGMTLRERVTVNDRRIDVLTRTKEMDSCEFGCEETEFADVRGGVSVGRGEIGVGHGGSIGFRSDMAWYIRSLKFSCICRHWSI